MVDSSTINGTTVLDFPLSTDPGKVCSLVFVVTQLRVRVPNKEGETRSATNELTISLSRDKSLYTLGTVHKSSKISHFL